jgi:hypothetical protein
MHEELRGPTKVVLSITLMLLAGCTLDFNEAIPCDTDNQCPTELVCDTTVRRCVADEQGEGRDVFEDTDEEDEEAGEEDGRELPDVADGDDQEEVDEDDDADSDEDDSDDDGNDEDGEEDDADDAVTDGSSDGGACVPATEVCDGVDNDCDEDVDEGLSCGGGCGAEMVEVTPATGSAYCIDKWEASRNDATATAEGSDTSIATSRTGVLPWRFVTYDQAEAACTAAGKRLCTADEWRSACGGPDGWDYPYNARIYNGQTCNGINTPPLSGPAVTGQFASCVSPVGVLDMSGNVSEWTTNRFPIGGAYDDVSQNLRCSAEDRVVNPSVSEPQAGFRCCRTP